MSKFFIILVGAFALIFVNAACASVPFVAQNQPTATATRRIRPTFTPKPLVSPTQEVESTDTPEPTEEPTEEPQPTVTPVPATAKPTNKPAVVQPTKPPAPTQPPKPQFAVNITKDSDKYFCGEEGSSVHEVVSSVKKGKNWAGGYYLAAFNTAGQLLTDGAGKNLIGVSDPDFSLSIGSNCRVEADFTNPNASNAKIDVNDPVLQGTTQIIIRFIKSPTDLTPLSPDFAMDFSKNGRWFLYVQVK